MGGGVYPSVEVQSVYSTAPADRADRKLNTLEMWKIFEGVYLCNFQSFFNFPPNPYQQKKVRIVMK